MSQCGFDRCRENPKLRDVYHDEQNESRLGQSRSATARQIANRFDCLLLRIRVHMHLADLKAQ